MSTNDPHLIGSRADRSPAVRGIVLDIRETTLVVTVMPSDAPPYRARVQLPVGASAAGFRVGAHLELEVGSDPSDVQLTTDLPRSG